LLADWPPSNVSSSQDTRQRWLIADNYRCRQTGVTIAGRTEGLPLPRLLGIWRPPKRREMEIKVCVEDYGSFREAIRDFRRLTRPTTNRRHGRVRKDYFIKPSQLRRWRKGNATIRARYFPRLTGGHNP